MLGVLFVLLHASGRLPAPFVLAWNIFGIADLVNAIGMGVASSPGPLQVFGGEPGAAMMATLPWLLIPAFLGPLLACTHLAVFWRLGRARQSTGGMQIA